MSLPKLNIGFLGSPDISASILDFIIKEDLVCVKTVWTNIEKKVGRGQKIKKTEVQLTAEKYNLRIEKIKTFKDTVEEQIAVIRELKIDLLFVVAYGHILPEAFFNAPRYGSINLHFSLLPLYRGASPVQSCILNGDKESGVTIQRVANQVDHGDILLRETFDINNCNALEVFEKSITASKKTLPSFFKNYEQYFDKKISQQEIIEKENIKISYCQKIKKEDANIHPEETALDIKRKFLAYFIWPKIFFYVQQIKYQIEGLGLLSEASNELQETYFKEKREASFLYLIDRQLVLALSDCRDDAIVINKIKKSGKGTMLTKDFLNGCRWEFPIQINILNKIKKVGK